MHRLALVGLAAAAAVAAPSPSQVVTQLARPRRDASVTRLTRGLASGRLVLRDLAFAAGSARLDSAARPVVRRLAAAINATPGTYLIEAHVEDTGDSARDFALSQRRAVEVKALLVLEGVPSGRLISVGFGAARPLAGTDGDAGRRARIEVARAQ